MNNTSPALTHGSNSVPGWQLAWAQLLGSRHELTEDALGHRAVTLAQPAGTGIYVVVADGVGGGARGDIAAQALVQHCLAVPEPLLTAAAHLTAWLRLAEAHVQKALRAVTFSPGAATLAAAWLNAEGEGYLLRVGDARLYHVDAEGQVSPLSDDQTYRNIGELPPPGASGDDPARMVGTGYMGEPELMPVHLNAFEAILLCSDGLHRGLTPTELATLLRHPDGLEAACLAMVQAARAAGSDDDISVLVARRKSKVGLWWRLLARLGYNNNPTT